MGAIKQGDKLFLYTSEADAPSEARELAEDFFEMTDFVFGHEWVGAVVEMLLRRDDMSVRDIVTVLTAVRERYKDCKGSYNTIARQMRKPPPKYGEGAA